MELTIGTMLFQIVAVIILIGLVSRFAIRPLMKVMQERQDHIDSQINTAEENRVEAEKLAAEQRETLKQAREEAKEIVERAKSQKEKEAQAIIQEAQERAERMIKEASAEITQQKEKAVKDLRDEVGRLSVQLASKVMEKEVDAQEQSKLINRYLEQTGEIQ